MPLLPGRPNHYAIETSRLDFWKKATKLSSCGRLVTHALLLHGVLKMKKHLRLIAEHKKVSGSHRKMHQVDLSPPLWNF